MSRAARVGALVATLALLVPAAAAHAAYPIQPSLVSAAWSAFWGNPAQAPPGVNRSKCTLTAAHPLPVILIDGTFANMQDDWGALGPVLANDGYCVFSTALGANAGDFIQTIGPVPTSAEEVAGLIQQVAARYGTQVDLVGHSQGGMLAEYVTKLLGLAPLVHAVVGLSPTTHGTTLDGLTALAQVIPFANDVIGSLCPACTDQETGSAVITALDNGPIAQPGVAYTVIETRNETVVTPVGSSFIQQAGVTNEYVQSFCPADSVDHADLPYDNTANRLVLNALDPATASPPKCGETYPSSPVQLAS